MVSFDDQARKAAIKNADSPEWSLRAAAGRELATSARIEEAADVLLRLLLDPHDTAVTQETAETLLARGDTLGLRYVLLAMSRATEDSTLDELGAAFDCTPDWMTDDGADRLIEHLGELAMDDDAGVRGEAHSILKALRPPRG